MTHSTPKKHRPRRVLQVITPSHMSGAEMQLVRLTRRMEGRGHFLPTIINRDSAAIAEMYRLGLNAMPVRIHGKASLTSLPVLARCAREQQAELVQSTLSTASWWCGWLDWLGGPPSVGHVQGFTSALWHRRQTHLLAVSNAVKADLVRQGIDPGRITVLYNALAPEDFRPARDTLAVRHDLGAESNTLVVGTFAHLSEKKGQRELIEAIPEVLRDLPQTQFWFVGQGTLLAELQATVQRLRISDNVRFLGYRRDAADLMHAIDVMALPSHREPCALVYVEAALSRKPIVACHAGGAPESIADGETGLLVPVGDSAAIAQSLLTLLTDRDRAARMGQAGFERARELFCWEGFIQTLEEVYEKVLDERAANRPMTRRPAA